MKAKVLLTGEIVYVYYIGQRGTEMIDMYIDSFNRTYAKHELEFINETDESVIVYHVYNQVEEEKHWQDVRERAAIAAMQGVMNFFGSLDYNKETIAKLAVEQADALIEELKKK